jgi:hypothetical protein
VLAIFSGRGRGLTMYPNLWSNIDLRLILVQDQSKDQHSEILLKFIEKRGKNGEKFAAKNKPPTVMIQLCIAVAPFVSFWSL